MNPINEEITTLVEQFIELNEDNPKNRLNAFTEEVGELATEVNRATGIKVFKEQRLDREAMGKEVADVIYNVVAIAFLFDIDWEQWLLEVARENVGSRMDRPTPAQRFPEVICLCGSTMFEDRFDEETARLGKEGSIVLGPVGFFKDNHEDEWEGLDSEEDKLAVDELHKRKIDLADRVFVINPDGYVGDSTRGEIAYAMGTGTPVDWLERPRGPNAGGCWICLTGNGRDGEMSFDPEFDTYYHEECLDDAGFESVLDYERDKPVVHTVRWS